MTDVYLIHNNYNKYFTSSKANIPSLLWLACLWDSNSTEGLKFKVFRWNHQEFKND
ncbi:hypothetical protein Anas_04335 [Armadillidium nasatum]|uniref:Uncharacterized protein n=1 Tax=Armadillidium nasatum TaxID=96803 RepID=A0A5N5TJS4_9CRUS|nr:hypothetical protein Anas_04335 [Armadillidium nasatum]